MLKINIVSVGKIKEKYIRDGIQEFEKRLSKYIKLKTIEILEEKDNNDMKKAIEKESEKILEYMNKTTGYNILLDIKGEKVSSEEMASKISKLSLTNSEINLYIGGSNGVTEKIKDKANLKISFSNMTFPHQLMRLILLEQVYRWICIQKNIKYHK